MPRQARLDVPGTLHHVIIRGIERKEIVKDDHDRQNFVYRMGTIALCGHSVLMGNDWQDRDYVLKWFGTKEGEAKRNYRQFVKKGIALSRCPELVGGGLIKSQGGWSAVKAMQRIGVREKSDERILGSGEFVEQLIKQSDQTGKEQFAVYVRLQHAVSYVEKICDKENVSVKALKSGSRRRKITIVRFQLAKELVEEWGPSLTETSRHLGVSPSAIAKTLYRSDKHKSS